MFAAAETEPSMYANRPAAGGARPPRFLIGGKRPDPFHPDVRKVLEHAHAVSGPVSLVELFHPPAGIMVAFVTILQLTLYEMLAVLDTASDDRDRFGGRRPPAAFAAVFIPQESEANSAIHAAGCDQSVTVQSSHDYLPSEYRNAARASSLVESSVGSGESDGVTISGISVHPRTTASHPCDFNSPITSRR